MARLKVGSEGYIRAVFLKDRALSAIQQHGNSRKTNVGPVWTYDSPDLSILFSDLTTFAEANIDFKDLTPRQRAAAVLFPEAMEPRRHLDIWAYTKGKRQKTLSVVWDEGSLPEVVTFKRGDWERQLLS